MWTWTALDPDTKLMAGWLVGEQRRFTRLTNAFSRRRANLARAVSLRFAF